MPRPTPTPSTPLPVRRAAQPGAAALLLAFALVAGCAAGEPREGGVGRARAAMSLEQAPGPPADRQIIRTADLAVEVGDVPGARTAAEAALAARGGWLESVYETQTTLQLQMRVPADALDAFLEDLSGLGKVKRSSVSSRDVTEEHADLKVRLANSLKLRDRLRDLLDRATTVEQMLAVEKELARVQSEVESLQGRLERLQSQVAMSTVSLTLEPRRVLGPLGYVGWGLWWVIEKLFVIR